MREEEEEEEKTSGGGDLRQHRKVKLASVKFIVSGLRIPNEAGELPTVLNRCCNKSSASTINATEQARVNNLWMLAASLLTWCPSHT